MCHEGARTDTSGILLWIKSSLPDLPAQRNPGEFDKYYSTCYKFCHWKNRIEELAKNESSKLWARHRESGLGVSPMLTQKLNGLGSLKPKANAA